MRVSQRDSTMLSTGAYAAFMGVLGAWYRHLKQEEKRLRAWAEKVNEEANRRVEDAEERATSDVEEVLASTRSNAEELARAGDAAMAGIEEHGRVIAETAREQIAEERARFEQEVQEQNVLTTYYMESTLLLVEVRDLELTKERALELLDQLYDEVIARVDSEGKNGYRLPGVEIHRLRVRRLMGADDG